MLVSEYINKAMDLTITQADNGMYYLEPTWFLILWNNNMRLNTITDKPKVSEDMLREILELEVKRRNTGHSKKPAVIDWLYEIITAQIEPAILAEETDYIKQVTEFMKANHEAQRSTENS